MINPVEESQSYRTELLAELARRKARNSSYSLRAFARDLGVSLTALSDAIGAKRHLSRRNLVRVAERLALTPRQLERALFEARGRAPEPEGPEGPFLSLREDEFRLISDWYCFAILSLARLRDCPADAGALARRLGISAVQARDALGRLKRLGYVRAEGGRLRRTALPLRTTTDVPSAALRSYHRQGLERAVEALERVPVERREISSVTLAIDSRRIPEAKRAIAEFKRRFERLMEGGEKDAAYALAVQLFPVDCGAGAGGNER